MGELIDDLLNLSRIGRIELRRVNVDLSAQANAVADTLRATSPERDVEFDIAEGMTARGDARLLRIALENLFSNAWKFTGRRSPARIAFGQKEIDGEIAYYIKDNGAGFDMAYVGKLFGAFQRLHDVREFPGSGIGLAIVQRIIARHGGRIWAEAEPEKGAVFTFTL
jgi:signal transduction histidine kinase